MVQMISHAFSTGALFVGIGIMYDHVHSRLIKDYGGVVYKCLFLLRYLWFLPWLMLDYQEHQGL